MPSFAAVQAWAPADRRARVIAACNVLTAAFMTVAGLVVAALQAQGVGLARAVRRARRAATSSPWSSCSAPGARDGMQDVGRFMFQTFFGSR